MQKGDCLILGLCKWFLLQGWTVSCSAGGIYRGSVFTGNILVGTAETSDKCLYAKDNQQEQTWVASRWTTTNSDGIILRSSSGCSLSSFIGRHECSMSVHHTMRHLAPERIPMLFRDQSKSIQFNCGQSIYSDEDGLCRSRPLLALILFARGRSYPELVAPLCTYVEWVAAPAGAITRASGDKCVAVFRGDLHYNQGGKGAKCRPTNLHHTQYLTRTSAKSS